MQSNEPNVAGAVKKMLSNKVAACPLHPWLRVVPHTVMTPALDDRGNKIKNKDGSNKMEAIHGMHCPQCFCQGVKRVDGTFGFVMVRESKTRPFKGVKVA